MEGGWGDDNTENIQVINWSHHEIFNPTSEGVKIYQETKA